MCRMAAPQNDTSKIRAWLASQLKLEDVPEPIWEQLVEDEYVEEAQYPVFADAHDELVRQARKFLKIYRGGADDPQVPKKQRTGKRQKPTDRRRVEVEAEIAAKFAQATAAKDPDASPNGGEEKPETLAPEQQILIEYARALAESPLKGEISNNQITVTAKPWVSPEDVRRKFVTMRKIWSWTETPSARRVELVSFVVGFYEGYYNEERDLYGLMRGPNWPSWRGIMEQWNQRYPQEHDWHYLDVRNFRRDFNETFETLTSYKDF
jgi:hypothetical protein